MTDAQIELSAAATFDALRTASSQLSAPDQPTAPPDANLPAITTVQERLSLWTWHHCGVPGCTAAITEAGACLVHLSAVRRRRILAEAECIDLRGAHVPTSLVTELRTVAAKRGNRITAELRCDGALFDGAVELHGLVFERAVSFVSCGWTGPVDFSRSSFMDGVSFVYSVFDVAANFEYCGFEGTANFSKCRFGTTFDAQSYTTTTARFICARFRGTTYFDQVVVAGAADLPGCQFDGDVHLGPLAVGGQFLSLSESTFAGRCHIYATAAMVWLDRIRVQSPLIVSLRHASVSLQNASLDAETQVEYWDLDGRLPWAAIDDAVIARSNVPLVIGQAFPRILALRGTPLSQVVLRDANLEACLFTGALELDRLVLHGDPIFPRTPVTGRLLIADEIEWRHLQPHRTRRSRNIVRHPAEAYRTTLRQQAPAVNSTPDGTTEETASGAAQKLTAATAGLLAALPQPRATDVEALYRLLRKRFEDSGDRPGADDFYYGEMQMRRRASNAGGWIVSASRKSLVTAYWLLSGYGLRAWRPTIALVMLMVLGAWGLRSTAHEQGPPGSPPTPGPISPISAVYDAAELCIAAIARSEPSLVYTSEGRLIRLALVVCGPALIALILVALRARLRRSG